MKINNIIDDAISWLSRNVSLLRRTDGKFLRRLEKRARARANRIFKMQMNFIIKNGDRLSPFVEQNKISKNSLNQEINDLMREVPGQAQLAEEIVAIMNFAIRKGARQTIKKLKLGDFGVTFDLVNRDAIRFLGGKLSHELSKGSGTIHATTIDRISGIIRKGAEEGASYGRVAELIKKQGKTGVFSFARSEMIAVREVAVAYEEGNNIPIQKFKIRQPDKIVLKKWLTVGDDRVTEPHRENERMGWIQEAEVFVGTGDKIAPGSDNPRCRCTTLYRISA